MSGRLGHIAGDRRVGHIPRNMIRQTNYRYGFGGWNFNLVADLTDIRGTVGGSDFVWRDNISGIEFIPEANSGQLSYNSSDSNFNNFPSISFREEATTLQPVLLANRSFHINTIAFIVKAAAIQGRNVLLTGDNLLSGDRIDLGGTLAGATGIGWYNTTTPLLIGTTENTSPHIVVMTTNYVIVDGVVEATGSVNVASFNRISNSTDARGLRGRLREILIHPHVLTSTDGLLLCNRINEKYAIY